MAEEVRLLERAADDLQADRQLRPGETAGHADARQPRQIHPDRVDVVQVHRERIGRLLPLLERRRRRGRREDGVDLLIGPEEIPADERADFLGAQVIGVVVAAAQHVGAQHDPALDLLAESLGARLEIKVHRIAGLRRAVAVADAVVAREVRGALGCGDDVIGAHRIFRVRQGDRPDLAAQPAVIFDRRLHRGTHLGIEAFAEILLRDAELPASARLRQLARGNRDLGRGTRSSRADRGRRWRPGRSPRPRPNGRTGRSGRAKRRRRSDP